MLPALTGALALFAAVPALAATLADYRDLIVDGRQLKWGAPLEGTGASVTYAFADAGFDFRGARNCGAIAPLAGLLDRARIARTDFRREAGAAFAAWQAVAGISFSEAQPEDADIIIGAEVEPIGRAFTNVVSDATTPKGAISPLRQAVICLNPQERWKIGFDGDLDAYDLRYTLMHEIGHAIGLDHPPGRKAVMDFAYREEFRNLQPGDIAGVVGIYGPPAGRPAMAEGKPARPALARGAESESLKALR
jgi:hypothetical protein